MDKTNLKVPSINNILNFAIVSSLLILGSLNPASKLDYFFSVFTFALFLTNILLLFLRGLKTKEAIMLILIYVISLFLFVTIFVHQKREFMIPIYSFVSALLITAIFRRFDASKLLVLSILSAFIVTSFTNSSKLREVISAEPKPRTYFNDQLSFLKVAYLVESGKNYYSAFEKAITEDGRKFTIPMQVWGWRLPTFAYIWAFLPGTAGPTSYWLFIALSLGFFFISFKLAEIFLPSFLAVLSVYLVFPYFHFAARDVAFLEIEWWGLIFFTFGIYSLLKKNYNFSSLFFLLSITIREIFVIPLLTILLLLILYSNFKAALKLLAALLAFLIFWSLHYFQVSRYTGVSLESLQPRDHPLSTFFLLQTLSYASWEYLVFNFRPFLLSFAALVTLTLTFVIRKTISFPIVVISLVPLSMALAILKIGTPPYDDYWGISYIPLVLLSLPILIFKAFELKKNKSV